MAQVDHRTSVTRPPDGAAEPAAATTDALVQSAFEVMTVITAAAARHELSLTLWRILAILRDRSPRMSDLSDHLRVDRSTVTGIVDRAAARGLVHRYADADDRRASRVALTAAGHDLARDCAAEVDDDLAPLLSRLSRVQREQLTRALQTINTP